jgi:hypothetical protein
MEPQYVIDVAFGLVAVFLGWTVKRIYHSLDDLWRKHDETMQRITRIAIDLPKQYVTKDDLSKAIDTIHERFDKLDVKLESYYNHR